MSSVRNLPSTGSEGSSGSLDSALSCGICTSHWTVCRDQGAWSRFAQSLVMKLLSSSPWPCRYSRSVAGVSSRCHIDLNPVQGELCHSVLGTGQCRQVERFRGLCSKYTMYHHEVSMKSTISVLCTKDIYIHQLKHHTPSMAPRHSGLSAEPNQTSPPLPSLSCFFSSVYLVFLIRGS